MNPWLRRLHLLLSIGGGFSGMAVSAQKLFSAEKIAPIYYVAIVAFIAIFAYGVFAGLRFAENPLQLQPLAIFYWLQVPRLAGPFLIYQLSAGIWLTLDVSSYHVKLFLQFGNSWQIGIFEKADWALGLNFFALGMALITQRQIKKNRLVLDATPSESIPPMIPPADAS